MKPGFPFLADEIAEPCPDMNIKVAAFTVSEKTNNIKIILFRKKFLHGKMGKHMVDLGNPLKCFKNSINGLKLGTVR